ncbi:PKD domain-containing protein [Algoriphagus sp. CAU 1675]|uniref:PKD domain-containing protein n=1 Tax=Algoriphagus sp. CAU 1675 TaxID=3032597 RepID=UPI0023DC2681|nr:PKD domain-containing protein [Algoriphagus sp. CAU 1675]MDF2159259.1 PKD domain-containing protein [Algoriphagus sp. CAU 1675]
MSFRILFSAFFLCLISLNSYGQVGFPYCETFGGSTTQSATIYGADAVLVSGVLRLTSNETGQRGYVYVDIPFSSLFGIKASFEYFSYGGTGADGLTFFLFDAAVPNFAIGGFGGSLGYSKRGNEPGLAGAYLGIGFDEYGNFGNTSEGKSGGFPGVGDGLAPDAIVVRGPGNGFLGYDFIMGKRTMEDGVNGLPINQQFPISSGGTGTSRITTPNQAGYRKVFINLEPNPNDVGYLLTLEMEVTTEPNNPRLVTIFDKIPYQFSAPDNLKVGFSASTGGSTNFHEIKNLIVEVSNDEGLLDPEGVDFSDIASCEGQENTYFITDEEVVLPNPNSVIRCLQFYKSLDDIEEESSDICSQGKCREENRELVLDQGIFRAGDVGGDFTFFPFEGFTGQTVTVFYTITDSYGKTSEGNSMTLLIQESPEPVSVFPEGAAELKELVRLCPEETFTLEARGEEVYERFEWYKDGELLAGEEDAILTLDSEGEYYAVVYNRKNCPSVSNIVKIEYPEFPEPVLRLPVVGCVPGEPVDGRTGILNFDLNAFDYQLSDGVNTWVNEEIEELFQSGIYELRLKHKDLSCFSEPFPFEIVILERELLADFEFEVQGTGIQNDEDGGIFSDDILQFMDLSDDRAIEWFWDFGDGSFSSEKNPTHVFGKKGDFEITLTITDEYGCQKSVSKLLSITKSYRIMVPNAFTPNDSENQYFTPKYKGLVCVELLVFNLWGDLIFRSEELNGQGWDGKLEGKLLDAGWFVFRFNAVSVDGEKIVKTGKFKLVR